MDQHLSHTPHENQRDPISELFWAELPAPLPIDRLIAQHAQVSELQYQAAALSAPESYYDYEALAAARKWFRDFVKGAQSEVPLAGVLFHSALVEQGADGSKAYSVVAEVRSRNGKTMLASNGHLHETEGGPALYHIRQKDGVFQYQPLYSFEAFEAELDVMRERGHTLLHQPASQPFLLSAAIQAASRYAERSLGISGPVKGIFPDRYPQSPIFFFAIQSRMIDITPMLDASSSTIKFSIRARGGR